MLYQLSYAREASSVAIFRVRPRFVSSNIWGFRCFQACPAVCEPVSGTPLQNRPPREGLDAARLEETPTSST